jgi:hypothetical protein
MLHIVNGIFAFPPVFKRDKRVRKKLLETLESKASTELDTAKLYCIRLLHKRARLTPASRAASIFT